MEILIQGTKGGWKLLYPTALTSEAMYRFASDARRTDSKGNIRWQFYSIAFGGQGCVFSKYVGVRDVLRQFGGYVAFSVNIPNSKKMSGNDIKLLLDELAGRYCNDYVVNGNLGGEVHEDWTFVKAIESQYESRLRQVQFRDMVSEQSGSGEPSFIYYESDAELCKLLDSPYQDEYSSFKQVFLLDGSYESSPESPLNAIRHDSQANLTGKIDLENPRYKLVIQLDKNNTGVDVEVKSNGKRIFNDNKVYRKDKLTINYTKKYCTPLPLEGKITDAELQQYLEIDEDNRIVSVKRDVTLELASKKLVINVTDLKGRSVENVEVKVSLHDSNSMKSEFDGGFVFVGEELGKKFTVTARKNNLSGSKQFVPIQIDGNIIPLTIQICPEKVSNESFYPGLKKKEMGRGGGLKTSKKQYYLEVDPIMGSKGNNWSEYIENINDRDKYLPKAKKGYKFVGWESHINEPTHQCDGHFKAIFKETWWHRNKRKTLFGAIILIVIVSIIVLLSKGKKTPSMDNNFSFNYVNDSIAQCDNNIEKLEALKNRWNGYQLNIEKKGGFFGIGGSPDPDVYESWLNGLKKIDSAINFQDAANRLRKEIVDYLNGNELMLEKLNGYKNNNLDADLNKRLESCIQLREMLNAGNVSEIKQLDFSYSRSQQSLQNAIAIIPSNAISSVSVQMNSAKISTMSLDAIAEFINNKVAEYPTTTKTAQGTTNTTKQVSGNKVTSKSSACEYTQEQLVEKFWSLINEFPKNHEKFDSLLSKKGWNTNSEEYNYLNKYLSWGSDRKEPKKQDEEKYNYFKVFKGLRKSDVQGYAKEKNIKDLKNYTESYYNDKYSNNK